LDVPVDVCMARVGIRTDHPTLPPSQKSQDVVSRFSSILCKPHAAEGFGVVTSVKTDQMDALLTELARFPTPPTATPSSDATNS
jgi:hypothetical protein